MVNEVLSDRAYMILRSAVNLVRNEKVLRVSHLKHRLNHLFPDEPEQVDEALRYWANREVLVSQGKP
jgi:hypothetical protein